MKRKIASLALTSLVVVSIGACAAPAADAELLTTGGLTDSAFVSAPKPGKGCKWVADKHGGYYTSKSPKNMDGNYFFVPLGAVSKVEQCPKYGKVRIIYNGKVGWIWNG